MACPTCRRRAALIAVLAPAISRCSPNRHGLLGLLALGDEQLCHAAGGLQTRETLRQIQRAVPTHGVPTALCRHDPGYPRALAQLPSAPAVLHATCTAERLGELLTAPVVAIVGNRTHTRYTREVTRELARALAIAGVTVISGVNEGLEGISHHGALHASHGRTLAVLPCSPDTLPYPRRDSPLHRRILARGAAISEFGPGFFPPRPWCFIAAQRIIAALARVIVVVEADDRSSALFTAHVAAELGHDVAVVPGRVTDPAGDGTFALLRDGAHPVAGARDVLELIYGAGTRAAA
jgi:DNA processing protein